MSLSGPLPCRTGAVAIGLALALCARPSAAQPGPAASAVALDCPELASDAVDAVEARARGAVWGARLEPGELSLRCGERRLLAHFRSRDGARIELERERPPPARLAEELVDLAHELVLLAAGAAPPPAPATEPAATEPAAAAPAAPAAEAPAATLAPSIVAASPRDDGLVEGAPAAALAAAGFALRTGAELELWGQGIPAAVGPRVGLRLPLGAGIGLVLSGAFQLGTSSAAGLSARHGHAGAELELSPSRWLELSSGVDASLLWLDGEADLEPRRRASLAPAWSLRTSLLLPLGPARLALGPALRLYSRERRVVVDGATRARLPGQTLSLLLELGWPRGGDAEP
jgi:hypothetical protein